MSSAQLLLLVDSHLVDTSFSLLMMVYFSIFDDVFASIFDFFFYFDDQKKNVRVWEEDSWIRDL